MLLPYNSLTLEYNLESNYNNNVIIIIPKDCLSTEYYVTELRLIIIATFNKFK